MNWCFWNHQRARQPRALGVTPDGRLPRRLRLCLSDVQLDLLRQHSAVHSAALVRVLNLGRFEPALVPPQHVLHQVRMHQGLVEHRRISHERRGGTTVMLEGLPSAVSRVLVGRPQIRTRLGIDPSERGP